MLTYMNADLYILRVYKFKKFIIKNYTVKTEHYSLQRNLSFGINGNLKILTITIGKYLYLPIKYR